MLKSILTSVLLLSSLNLLAEENLASGVATYNGQSCSSYSVTINGETESEKKCRPILSIKTDQYNYISECSGTKFGFLGWTIYDSTSCTQTIAYEDDQNLVYGVFTYGDKFDVVVDTKENKIISVPPFTEGHMLDDGQIVN